MANHFGTLELGHVMAKGPNAAHAKVVLTINMRGGSMGAIPSSNTSSHSILQTMDNIEHEFPMNNMYCI